MSDVTPKRAISFGAREQGTRIQSEDGDSIHLSGYDLGPKGLVVVERLSDGLAIAKTPGHQSWVHIGASAYTPTVYYLIHVDRDELDRHGDRVRVFYEVAAPGRAWRRAIEVLREAAKPIAEEGAIAAFDRLNAERDGERERKIDASIQRRVEEQQRAKDAANAYLAEHGLPQLVGNVLDIDLGDGVLVVGVRTKRDSGV